MGPSTVSGAAYGMRARANSRVREPASMKLPSKGSRFRPSSPNPRATSSIRSPWLGLTVRLTESTSRSISGAASFAIITEPRYRDCWSDASLQHHPRSSCRMDTPSSRPLRDRTATSPRSSASPTTSTRARPPSRSRAVASLRLRGWKSRFHASAAHAAAAEGLCRSEDSPARELRRRGHPLVVSDDLLESVSEPTDRGEVDRVECSQLVRLESRWPCRARGR